ncbi:HET-domain-containing protein, partial [Aulographum hederae CBS 113979]
LEEYACLSHCWGGLQPIQTTRGNIESHKRGIDLAKLPLTFREAVLFTRRLGIRYLWIDSLCIIQDNILDWQEQSSNMCSVYGNSHLVLAATKAANPMDGCFAKSQSEYVGWHSPSSAHDNFPLLQRAWVLQERYMAPRVLHFTQEELMWECMAGQSCECTAGGVSNFPLLNIKTGAYHMTSADSSEMNMLWRLLVKRYSSLDLSFESDRLAALSGLAKYYQSHGAGEYLAGVWKEHLREGDLAWTVRPHKSKRRSVQLAPTWSWASIEGSVSY